MEQNWIVELPIFGVGSMCEVYVIMERIGLMLPMNTPSAWDLSTLSSPPSCKHEGMFEECRAPRPGFEVYPK